MRFTFLQYCLVACFAMALSAYTHAIRPYQKLQYHRQLSTENPIKLPTASLDQIQIGKALFKANCAACHNKNMKDDLTGPALGGVENRWSDYPKEDLYAWVRNSQALAAKKHPKAVALINQWNGATMNAFPNLNNDEIEQILSYIRTME